MLKLNDKKMEFMVIQSRHARDTPYVTSISVGDSDVLAVESARNMSEHFNVIAKSSYAQLRSIALIYCYLTPDAAAMLIDSFITSRLNNCNSLLYGLVDDMIRKL